MKVTSILVVAAVAIAAACGGNPQPGDPGYSFNLNGEYNAEFAADDGQVYSGTMQLTTGPGGVVTGTMTLLSPMSIDGTVEGMIVGAQLDVTVQYFIADIQCGGTASSTATIEEGGDAATGPADITSDDDCAGGPVSATFSLSR